MKKLFLLASMVMIIAITFGNSIKTIPLSTTEMKTVYSLDDVERENITKKILEEAKKLNYENVDKQYVDWAIDKALQTPGTFYGFSKESCRKKTTSFFRADFLVNEIGLVFDETMIELRIETDRDVKEEVSFFLFIMLLAVILVTLEFILSFCKKVQDYVLYKIKGIEMVTFLILFISESHYHQINDYKTILLFLSAFFCVCSFFIMDGEKKYEKIAKITMIILEFILLMFIIVSLL